MSSTRHKRSYAQPEPVDLGSMTHSRSGSQNELEGEAATSPTEEARDGFLPLQSSYGNAAVAQMVQRKEVEGTSRTSDATAPVIASPADAQGAAAVLPTTAPTALIVEDTAETLAPGQMRKSEFLSQLRSVVSVTTAEALADTPWSADDCPYLDRVFAYCAAQDSQRLERAIRKYAPEAGGATSAASLIPLITGKVRQSVSTWARTGEVTEMPEGVPSLSGGLLGECGGAVASVMSRVAGAAASATAGVGSAVSSVANVLFKKRDGRASAADDPVAIQSQLGSGQALDGRVRSQMEMAFGASLSDVRVHSDANAGALSDDMNARAFTVGQHIAFSAGEYKPGTLIGDALIAHELAHVMQQRAGISSTAPVQKGAEDSLLEEAADEAAVGAVVSVWGGRSGLARIRKRALPSLKSGLKLQRCKATTSKGPIGAERLAKAYANFQSQNDHLSGDELKRIHDALEAVTKDNLDIWIRFYDYFSNHSIKKAGEEKTKKFQARGQYAETKPDDDMILRPDLLTPSFPLAKLGTTLIHEFTHSRHDTNFMGTRDYQEGESYGIEYFFAVRVGEKSRQDEILDVMAHPEKIAIPAQEQALKLGFRAQCATMQGLYEIIDTGKSSHSGSPFVTPALLTAEEAQALASELVRRTEDDRSQRLKDILNWVKKNLGSFKLPAI